MPHGRVRRTGWPLTRLASVRDELIMAPADRCHRNSRRELRGNAVPPGYKCRVAELLDGRNAPTAPRPATQTGIDLTDRRRTMLRRRNHREDLVVTDHIARADNHDAASTSDHPSYTGIRAGPA